MSAVSARRNPVALALSAAPWKAAWYLLAYQVMGWVLFAIALTAITTGAVLSITLAGIPVLIGAAGVIRWCANSERARLRTIDGAPVGGHYRDVTGSGVIARLRARWRDPATWRDVGYLLGAFVPLVTLGLLVLGCWLILLAGVALPLWYWAPWQTLGGGLTVHGVQLGYFPNGPHGHPGYGVYIDTLPKALIAAAVSLVLFLLFNYVLVATARLHARTARALLGPQEDPLKEAKDLLHRPGPLASFIQLSRTNRRYRPTREGPAHGWGPGTASSPA